MSIPFLYCALSASAASRTTVRMVPSIGLLTALYADCTPPLNPATSAAASMVSQPVRPFAKPVRICEKITPELPRAPMTAPKAALPAYSPTLGVSAWRMNFAADCMVIAMFVPVSPSGTGNTFSWFTLSLCRSKLSAPARIILKNCSAEMFSIVSSNDIGGPPTAQLL